MLRDIFGYPRWMCLLNADGGGGSAGGGGGTGSGGDGGQGGAGTGGNAGGVAGSGGDGGQKTYDEEYVKSLRSEAAKHRTKAKELEDQVKNMPNEITAKVLKALGLEPDPNKNYENQLAEARKKGQDAEERANQKLIRAEVKAVATELGIVDADAALALIDRTGIGITDTGDVKGVKPALEALIKAKPYLVGKPGAVGGGSNPAGSGGGAGGAGSGKSMNDFIRRAAGKI